MQAFALLLLLAGHSAFRTSQLANATGKSRSVATSLDDSSKHCSWSLVQFKCIGTGCEYRPLPLDKTRSDQCRLSDEYMLSDELAAYQYIKLNANLLEEKSEKYRKSCAGSWNGWRCLRKAGRMLRASQLLARGVTRMQVTESMDDIHKHLDNTIRNLANTSGLDIELIMSLRDKLRANSIGFLKDPHGHMKLLVESLVRLAKGDDDDIARVKLDIDELHVASEPPSWEELDEIVKKSEKEVTDLERKIGVLELDELFISSHDEEDRPQALQEVMREVDDSTGESLRAHTISFPRTFKSTDNGLVSSLMDVDTEQYYYSPNMTKTVPPKSNIFRRSFKWFRNLPLYVHPTAIAIILTCISVAIEMHAIEVAWEALAHEAGFDHAQGGLVILVGLAQYVFKVIPIFLCEMFFHYLVHKWKQWAISERDPRKNRADGLDHHGDAIEMYNPEDVDCDEDLEFWQSRWSRDKMVFCCNTENKGCQAPGLPGAPWGKAALYTANWRRSAGKRSRTKLRSAATDGSRDSHPKKTGIGQTTIPGQITETILDDSKGQANAEIPLENLKRKRLKNSRGRRTSRGTKASRR